jgi:hypothetical protein
MSSSPSKAKQTLASVKYDAALPTPPPMSPPRLIHESNSEVSHCQYSTRPTRSFDVEANLSKIRSIQPPNLMLLLQYHQTRPEGYNNIHLSISSRYMAHSYLLRCIKCTRPVTDDRRRPLQWRPNTRRTTEARLSHEERSALSQSVHVAKLAKRVAIKEYEDSRRTSAAKKGRITANGKRRRRVLSKKIVQAETSVPEAVVVKDTEPDPNNRRRVLPWLMISGRTAARVKKNIVQNAVGEWDSSSMTDIGDRENEELPEEDGIAPESDPA